MTRRGEGRLVGKVYVRVLAEGPTRIIRFSDTDESVDDSTNEQAFDLLKVKKRQLEEDINAVHKYVHVLGHTSVTSVTSCSQLKTFEDKCGLDMSMMCSGIVSSSNKVYDRSISEDHAHLLSVQSSEPLDPRPMGSTSFEEAGDSRTGENERPEETKSTFRQSFFRSIVRIASFGIWSCVWPQKCVCRWELTQMCDQVKKSDPSKMSIPKSELRTSVATRSARGSRFESEGIVVHHTPPSVPSPFEQVAATRVSLLLLFSLFL